MVGRTGSVLQIQMHNDAIVGLSHVLNLNDFCWVKPLIQYQT